MVNYPPNIEQLNPVEPGPPTADQVPWQRSLRVRLFLVTFLLVAAIGLVITFAQRPVYESQATLLTSARQTIDLASTAADPQHVAIQRQLLLGEELILATLSRLRAEGYQDMDAKDIRSQLAVEAVPDTNLVAMTATGTDAELLPRMINTWIDVYLQARAAEIEEISGHTVRLINEELQQLAQKLEQARAELAAFREANGIISGERTENEALSRLNGLQRSLNNALEEEVKARSKLESLSDAAARGDTVIPRGDQQALIKKEAELDKLETQLADLNERYTQEYMALQPSMRVIPDQIEELRAEIESIKKLGNQKVLEETRQDHANAQRAVANIRAQLEEHKQQAKDFSAIFAEHRARVSDLENLELINRETQARLTQIETRQVGKYPQVTIITRATVSETPIGPEYGRNTLISLAAALVASVFAVWLAGFLNPALAPRTTVSTANVYLHRGIGAEPRPEPRATQIEKDSQLGLDSNPSGKLPGPEGGPDRS
jgi:uncharacterized protein involved in exopolysaccharide biosynthesis